MGAAGGRGQRRRDCAFTLLPLTGPEQMLQFEAYSASSWWKQKLRGWAGEFGKRSIERDKKPKKLQRHRRRLLPPTLRSQPPSRKRLEGEHAAAEDRATHCVRGLAAPQPGAFTHSLLRVLRRTSHVTPEALHPSCRLGCSGRCGRRLLRRR